MVPAPAFPAQTEKLTFELNGSDLFLLIFILGADGQQGWILMCYPVDTKPRQAGLCGPRAYKTGVNLVWYL